MRISDIAQAADTTARTVRHCHRLGLLDEPKRLANGYHAYDMADLVRLMRVRWLAGAGVPLGSVSSMIAATTDDTADADFRRADRCHRSRATGIGDKERPAAAGARGAPCGQTGVPATQRSRCPVLRTDWPPDGPTRAGSPRSATS
ncbi:MerR family transcriptional regulator [Rhodococcus sp. OK519]|uniref:MerR family transcriptional regulator n=1 Tax=Rhodococcus sp. OK519 TaxID=2135729 RepID=UPI000D38A9DF